MRRVPFFGRAALFPSGPFVLARLAGAPVIAVFAPRLGVRHYGVRIGQPHEVSKDTRDTGALDRVMAEVVAELEAAVKAYPTQWFQFTPFWDEQAQGAANVAARAEQTVEQLRARGQ